MNRRILLVTVVPALLAPMLAQAGSIWPEWGTRDRSRYDFTPYQTTRVHVDHDSRWDRDRDWDDQDWNRKGCPPGLAKKNNGCMPPGQAKKHSGHGNKHWR